jgi:hypothetical protein
VIRNVGAIWLDPRRFTTVAPIAAIVALLDTFASQARAPRVPVDSGLLLFFLLAWALVVAAYLPFVVLRSAVGGVFRRFEKRAAYPLQGAFDWLCLGGVGILLQAPNVPPRELQVHLFYLMLPIAAASYAGVGWLEARSRVAWHLVRLLPAAFALWVASVAHWDRYEYIRIGCIGVFVVALTSWSTALDAKRVPVFVSQRKAALAVALSALFVLLLAQLLLPSSHTARLVLYSRSAHAHSILKPVLVFADGDSDGAASLFGGTDCNAHNRTVHPGASERRGNRRDDNCGRGDGKQRPLVPPSAAQQAPTPRRDVLLLSFDSLRWDATDALPKVRDTLGPHAEFSRAVSPAAQTFFSLAAAIRGKAVRQLNAKRSRKLWRDESPTLADVLNTEGYRSFTVLTNQRWASEYGVTGGFDVIWPMNHAARDAPRPYVDDRFVDAETTFAVALGAARNTQGPVLCWLHLMESHYPFHRGKRTGPTNRQGFEAALRAVDEFAARFIVDFRKARKADPIIIVFGDHGEEFGEHGGTNHGNTLYSDQVRVGLWVALPGVVERQVRDPVSIAGIPATVLQQLGVDVPDSMSEPSLRDLALGDGHGLALAVSEMPTPTRYMVAYTGGRYRLVTDAVHDTFELFDMDNDPLERVNIAGRDPEALAQMQQLAQDWNERH